jgi:hypothetical protein
MGALSGGLKYLATYLGTEIHSYFYATTPTAPPLFIGPKLYKHRCFLFYQIAISNYTFFSADYVCASA